MFGNRYITVVKIGGNVIDNEEALARFVKDFARLPSPKVLIHGGGKLATRLAEQMGVKQQMIDGRRITDKATLDIVVMVYAGAINKHLVAMLQAEGCNTLGLTGADGNIISAHRRKPTPIDYGFVGDFTAADIDHSLIGTLLKNDITPVFSAITHDGKGELLNSNADTVASNVALACSRLMPTRLLFCFEKRGVLRDVNDQQSVIRRITPDIYPQLKADGVISDGMIPKIDNAMKAIGGGVDSVVIKHSDDLLLDAGTEIRGMCNADEE